MPINEQHYHFNSIKVQLEPAMTSLNNLLSLLDFNSIKVQLERSVAGSRCHVLHISIP